VPRPVIPKPATEHLLVLTRMLQSVEVDSSLETRRKGRLRNKIGDLMEEWQKVAVPPSTSAEI
jgi:hypothetical protein